MEIKSLGYVGVASERIDEWRMFANDLLGMEVVDRSRSSVALRMDDRQQRILIERGSEACRYFGWEVADAAALGRMAARLEAAGIAVKMQPQAVAERRCVKELISFSDPAGNALELYYGAAEAERPFKSGRAISGFRTGPLGLGHIVLTTDSIERLRPFYEGVLGFRLSDYTFRPFKAFFFHINSRHHSFAMVETGTNGIHHIMVELYSLDDVGQGYDLALETPERVGVTLGRHSNDLMTSFYIKTPSGFMMEYGWGGRDIDVATWQPVECTHGPSLWGHERSWLGPQQRETARHLRIRAAQLGHRAPIHVLSGNHVLMSGATPTIAADAPERSD